MHFHDDLAAVEHQVRDMATLVRQALMTAADALKENDRERCNGVITGDDELDRRYVDIERRVIDVLALQAPRRDFARAVEQGYDPFTRGRADFGTAAEFGHGAEDLFPGWRQVALTNTTDWWLCDACAEDLEAFMARR